MGTCRCRICDGGDLEAVVRGSGSAILCSTPWDSNTAAAFCISGTAEKQKALQNNEACDKIMQFTMIDTKQEPASPDKNMPSIESPVTVSSASAPVYLKSPRTSATRNCATLDNSAQREVVELSAIKTDTNAHSLTKLPGDKRRKSQERRIMCVPMTEGSLNKQGGAGVPSDLWSWRKYGQKPIKGSPFPRCSSSKGCPARKQLERSRTDPTTLLITYTGDHNHVWPAHLNALVRSSRQHSLHDKKVQALCIPSTWDKPQPLPPTNDNHDDVSPPCDKWEPNSHFQANGGDNSLDKEDQYNSGLDLLTANHILDHNLFADLGELTELYLKDFPKISAEESLGTMVDPFNLFDWSSSATEIPNS